MYSDKAKLREVLHFEFDRFHPGRSSIADFLPTAYKMDVSAKTSSEESILAIRRALENFELAMLIYFGVSYGDAMKEARVILSNGPLVYGVEVCYIFFIVNMAVADTMRIIRLEKEEIVGEHRGPDVFAKLLTKLLDKAITGIPPPNSSTSAVTYFLRSTYDKVA